MNAPQMIERRKNGEAFLSRTEKLVAVGLSLIAGLFFVFRVYAQAVDTSVLAEQTKRRVDLLEQTQPALLYMACLSFRDQYPNQLPAVCETAIGRGR